MCNIHNIYIYIYTYIENNRYVYCRYIYTLLRYVCVCQINMEGLMERATCSYVFTPYPAMAPAFQLLHAICQRLAIQLYDLLEMEGWPTQKPGFS